MIRFSWRVLLATGLLTASTAAAQSSSEPESAPPLLQIPVTAPRPDAPTSPQNSKIVLNPDWIARPTGDDIRKVYPRQAASQKIDGRAVIRCAVTRQGRLQDCEIVSESPKGMGFGEAALALAPKFKTNLTQQGGQPLPDDARLVISIPFMAEWLQTP